MIGVDQDQYNGGEDHAKICAQLLALENVPDLADQNKEEQVEVDAEQQHENTDDPFGSRVCIAGDRVVEDREAARTCRCKSGDDRIVQRQSAKQKCHDLHAGQNNIYAVKNERGLAHLRHQLALGGTRYLGAHQMNGLSTRTWQNGQHEYQNAHAANPVRKAAPEQYAARQMLNGGQNGGTGGGKSGNSFKECIDGIGDRSAEEKGECAKQRHQNPGCADAHKALARIDLRVFGLEQSARHRYDQQQRDGIDEG